MDRLMEPDTILVGNNTIPGSQVPKAIREKIPTILQACREFGCDFYPTIVEFLAYSEMSEICSYGGFPVRYPHWEFGQEYEEMSKGYEHGWMRVYETVVNTSPCHIFCLDSNTEVDHVTVISHATGHNDFFKNNVYFSKTNTNALNELANHGTRIRRYMSEWGHDPVARFIDRVLSISTLIDPAEAWIKRQVKEPLIRQKRKYYQPRRLKVAHDYMEDWVHTEEWHRLEQERAETQELSESIGLFKDPTKNVFGYIKDHARLKPWQQDIIAMLYGEAMYFAPQRQTKTINEGWASYVDSHIMARLGFAEGGSIFDYARHKAGVLGGKYSMNPYKLGYSLFLWIEEMYNKGRFGREYEECDNRQLKENWDKKLGLGHQKVFEVREFYDDVTFVAEFLSQEFCNKYKFFHWQRFPDGKIRIAENGRDAKTIRRLLIRSYLNGGLPTIRLLDPNHRDKRIFLLEHEWDGRPLHVQKTTDTLKALNWLWGDPVHLLTRNRDGAIRYVCEDDKVEVQQQGSKDA